MTGNQSGHAAFVDEEDLDAQIRNRPRSVTLLNLKWLAERVRKTCMLKKGIADGTYSVDSQRLAKALLNEDGEE